MLDPATDIMDQFFNLDINIKHQFLDPETDKKCSFLMTVKKLVHGKLPEWPKKCFHMLTTSSMPLKLSLSSRIYWLHHLKILETLIQLQDDITNIFSILQHCFKITSRFLQDYLNSTFLHCNKTEERLYQDDFQNTYTLRLPQNYFKTI